MHIATLRQGRFPSHAVAGRLCDFLKARPDVSPLVPPGFLIHLPQSDPAECLSPEPAPEDDDLAQEALLGFGENQSFVIVYDGGPHQESVRRITVRDIALNDAKLPVLNAWCHEREALRAFRIDRIQAIITEDGDVIAPPSRFFRGDLRYGGMLYRTLRRQSRAADAHPLDLYAAYDGAGPSLP